MHDKSGGKEYLMSRLPGIGDFTNAGGLSVAETARTMGKGEGNVKVIQHKAIVKLREMMGQQRKAPKVSVYEGESA